MKKIICLFVLFVVAVTFLNENNVYATSTYGPNMPSKRGHYVGFEGQVLLKRILRKDYGEVKNVDYFMTVSYGITDWLCLDGKVGIGTSTPAETPHVDGRVRPGDEPSDNMDLPNIAAVYAQGASPCHISCGINYGAYPATCPSIPDWTTLSLSYGFHYNDGGTALYQRGCCYYKCW